ncbi:4-hydroxy-tetrahydrodipicolinate synthase [Gracilibacillus ureilyticus]|uniref:4-hydroxy-tetrahydrodipicolinate synthase n=1 Tax=Gracilibacillus ureilyticus TaxID=531814 RepID=A0A1H9LIP8_9BACI|nr:4-hydroxy-tetrahydrodipicolinate synthase [Gracilibacillus ureilyticus]SER10995.1 4-hydroxy-tetrahydrodipicolinate synthase [Gracilibacillus ureilyticus]
MNFGRVITAMVTPFDQNGKVDYPMTEQLINYLISNGTEGIVVAGTTGESPTLTWDEKINLIQFVVKIVNKRIPVIAGTGSNSTQASIDLSKQAERCGADAIMLVTPYYNKPSQQGMAAHFKAIANSTALPVMLYNIPGRSGVNLLPETIIELAETDNIVAVKEASGNLDAMAKIIRDTSSDFSLYSGDDSLTLPILAIGGKGVVSVSSHIVGNEMNEMISAFQQGRVSDAAVLHQQLLPTMQALFTAPNPSPVKAALGLIGLNVGSVRLPLLPLSEEEIHSLEKQLYFTENKYHAG